jgi:hypothetical protein
MLPTYSSNVPLAECCNKWPSILSNNKSTNKTASIYHYLVSLLSHQSLCGVSTFQGVTMELQCRPWQGGKILCGVIARILLYWKLKRLEMFRVWHVNHFPLTPSILAWTRKWLTCQRVNISWPTLLNIKDVGSTDGRTDSEMRDFPDPFMNQCDLCMTQCYQCIFYTVLSNNKNL